jgi:ribose 5-phosphate isomerase B
MSDTIVCLAADHSGVELKSKIKASLVEAGYRCLDLGPYTSVTSVDYIDYAQLAGVLIQNGDCDRGILICGTGIGMSIAANKLPKVRAAVVHNYESAGKCRDHNDANVLCLGTWIRTDGENIEISHKWLTEKIGEHRHARRMERIGGESTERHLAGWGLRCRELWMGKPRYDCLIDDRAVFDDPDCARIEAFLEERRSAERK